jgi:hypothetical protein
VEIGLSIQSIGLARVARSGAHSYEGAAVVGLGEASAGDGNSSGAQGLEAKAKVSLLVGWRYIRQAPHALRGCAFRNDIKEASTRKLLCGQGRDSEEGSEVVSRLSLSFTRRKGDSLPSQKFRRPI